MRTSHNSRQHIALRVAAATTLIADLLTVGLMSFAQASPTLTAAEAPTVSTASTGPSVVELLPTPSFPGLELPDLPLPTPEPEPTTGPSDHCSDRSYWESRTYGDPSDYVAACGSYPYWLDRGETPCLPGERGCDDGTGAPVYTGPTVGRPWSPEYGYYAGRSDGPKNSQGEPCMQGRDNNDPNC